MMAAEYQSAVPDQGMVDAHFQRSAHFWNDVYEGRTASSIIFQDRRDLVLSLADGIGLERDSSVLEAGCGAGALSVALAHKYRIDAVDTVQSMLDATRERAEKAGLGDRVKTRIDDANHLSYGPGAFDLVVAIGVLPWLRDIAKPLAEFARVLRPGGYLIVTIDNTWALNRILDPVLNPLLEPVKQLTRTWLSRVGITPEEARPYFTTIKKLDRSIGSAGFRKVSGSSLGFGPFTFFGIDILRAEAGVHLHRMLQRAADRGRPLIRSTGSHYVLTARKT